jgi:uncharacterized protein
MGRVVVSFSGGVDSTVLLAAAANALPDDHIAVFADIPMLSERQRIIAMNVAEELGIDTVTVKLGWDDMPGVRENTSERCYHCKRAIYSVVRRIASENGYDICVDGENSSDKSDERPGRRAASEFSIMSPLRDLGIERDSVREMFTELGLRTDVQKETCMATRISTDTPFDDSDMRLIEECEDIIRKISGVRQIRMRMYDGSAHLFTSPECIGMLLRNKNVLEKELVRNGISAVNIDLDGYRE